MSRLIDADALINQTDDKYTFGDISRDEHDSIVNALNFAPTIEPEPMTEQEAYYQGKIDGIKECTARLRLLTAEFKEMNGGDSDV